MMSEDEKKYNIFENILQKVNQKYIALPDDEVKRNNKLLVIIDKIIQKMKNKSVLFKNLYQNKYYGGSYYDGLKVGKPSEYDLDCVLRLPKIVEATVEVSDKPGYVHVVLNNMEALRKKVDETPKYEGLEKLLDENRLSAKKVKSWMESLMTSVWAEKIDGVQLKLFKNGPALTLKLEGVFGDKQFDLDVDVVPCFTFFDHQWPGGNYRKNPTKKNTFFVVPKSPNLEEVHYWRLSFQEQERELINDNRLMKPTIRLIKKIRDRYEDGKIASYFIKTVFLWELEKVEKSLWDKSLSYVFLTMLRKYADYMTNRSIPYYWNEEYNLIGDLSESTTSCIANRIRKIVEEINKNCLCQPYNIVNYILTKSEFDVDTFQKEVPLSKKFLKQLEANKNGQVVIAKPVLIDNEKKSEPNLVVVPLLKEIGKKSQDLLFTTELSSTPSSVSSSFEEITKEMINEFSSKENLESLCETLALGQRKITKLLETAIEKIDNLDFKVEQLRQEMDAKMIEEMRERSELVRMVTMLSKKVDEIAKKESRKLEDDIFLPIDDMLKRTADYLQK